MDARPLDMLHDTGNQDVRAVAYRIDFQFLSLQILIYQNRMILFVSVNDRHKFFNFFIGDRDLHPLSAKHIRRTDQNRISESVCHCFGLLRRIDRTARCSRNLRFLQNLVKQLSVFRGIHILCPGAKDRHAHLHQAFRQFDSCLSAKLYDRTVRFFNIDNILHIFRRKRFKIELIRNVKVCADRFGIVINYDRLIPFFGKCPCRMNGTIVKFDSLSDTDRAGTEHEYLFLGMRLFYFRLGTEHGIVIRRAGRKLGRTGVYHFESRCDAVLITHLLNLILRFTAQPCNNIIGKFQALCLF